MAESGEYLHEIYTPQPPSSYSVDIVFVHGLNPKSKPNFAISTWTHEKGNFWPKAQLPQSIPSARILLFSYNSQVAFDVSTNGIQQHANNLLDRLSGARDRQNPPHLSYTAPIIFVAHSLGGLVVKQALVTAKNNNEYKDIQDATYGLVFFAVPHQGGHGAALGTIAKNIVLSLTGNSKNDLVESLRKNSFFQENQADLFKFQLEDFYIVSIFEDRPTKIHGIFGLGASLIIVDKKSATLGLAGTREKLLTVNSNHSDVCKFEGDDDKFEPIKRAIKKLADSAILKTAADRAESHDIRTASSSNIRIPTSSQMGGHMSRSIPSHSNHEERHAAQATEQGPITNFTTTNYQNSIPKPLEELKKRRSRNAAFNSASRLVGGFDPPRCAESTRLGIIRMLEEWISTDGSTSSLFWLYGSARVGKSALAYSLSKKFQEKKQLMGSFFFFKNDPTRNNGDHLIPTLILDLVNSFEGIRPFIEERIRENLDLFTRTFETQIQELLIEPLLSLKSKGATIAHPRLIVIDGLDECEDRDIQCELLRVIARSVPHIPYPLRFLVTSRPEAHIADVFNHDPDLRAIKVRRYKLSGDPDADVKIRKSLEEEFKKIRRFHSLALYLPQDWPDREAITSLVEQSSGHFIYASTVIRYIGSSKHHPDDQLTVILRLRPSREGPYTQLDALYKLIFEAVENQGQLEKICLVLGILYFGSTNTGFFAKFRANTAAIEELLEMKAGDLGLLLDPILSLVAIVGDEVRALDKSLFDYLVDSSRSEHLPFDLRRVHEFGSTEVPVNLGTSS